MRKIVFAMACGLTAVVTSCGGSSTPNNQSQSTQQEATIPTAAVQELKDALTAVQGKGILFGQHDALAYGMGDGSEWNAVKHNTNDSSDIKLVTGSHPAIFSWDLGHIDDAFNLDTVPFDSIRSFIFKAYREGGINTISWHERNPVTNDNAWTKPNEETCVKNFIPGGSKVEMFNQKLDKVADFLNSLVLDGKDVPVIFRPWHEMDGSWFWWGNDHCTHDEYKALYRYTIEYLRSKGVDNIVVAYSPDRNFKTEEEYLQWYPGDDIVDIVGMDNYWDIPEAYDEKNKTYDKEKLDVMVKKLEIVVNYAKKHGKLPALTECGNETVNLDKWYTEGLLPVITANETTRQIIYAQVWRNRHSKHYYVPFKGHPQESDFVKFANDSRIFLLNDYNEFKKQTK